MVPIGFSPQFLTPYLGVLPDILVVLAPVQKVAEEEVAVECPVLAEHDEVGFIQFPFAIYMHGYDMVHGQILGAATSYAAWV